MEYYTVSMKTAFGQLYKLLSERMFEVDFLSNHARDYLVTIHEILMGLNPDDRAAAQENIEILKKDSFEIRQYTSRLLLPTVRVSGDTEEYHPIDTNIPGVTQLPPFVDTTADSVLTSATELYSRWPKLTDTMRSVIYIIKHPVYARMTSITMSATRNRDWQIERAEIIKRYADFIDTVVPFDDKFFNIVLGQFQLDENTISAMYVNVTTTPCVNKVTIRLLDILIRNLYDDRKGVAEQIVNKQKDSVLGATRIDDNPSRLLVRYGLMACGVSAARADILSHVDTNRLIEITYANSSPVEFTLAESTPSPTHGLDAMMIDKYKTAYLLPGGLSSVQHPHVQLPQEEYDWYHIIESIDGANYRLLARDGETKIPAHEITGLIHGLSTRCYQYHQLCAESILPYDDPIGAAVAVEYDSLDMAQYGVNPEIVTRKLITAFAGLPDDTSARVDMRKNNQRDFSKISSYGDFVNMMMDRGFVIATLQKIITHILGIGSATDVEQMLSYVVKLDTLVNKFMTEMRKQLARHTIPDRMFAESSPSELQSAYLQVIKSVIGDVVAEVDKLGMWSDYDMTLIAYYFDKRGVFPRG